MINPILGTAIQKWELWDLKTEFRNQKSETRIQKSEIANRNPWKSEIHNWEIRDQKPGIKSLISEMQLVISSSDNYGLSQFAMSLFRISNR